MFSGLSSSYKALLLAVIGNAGFAISDAAVKFLTPHYSIYQIITCDLLLAGALFLMFSSKLGGLSSLRDPRNAKFHILRGVCNLFGSITIVYLFSFFPLTSVYTVIFIMPFLMTLIAIPVYKERVGLHRWLAMIMGFGGILIAFQPWSNHMDPLMWLPLLGAPLFFALLHSMMRSIKGSSDLAIGFYPIIFAGISCIPLMFLLGDFHMFAQLHLLALLISASGIAIGFLFMSKAFHMADASLVSPMQYTQMLWGIMLGYLLFGDLPGMWILIGAVIIVLSGIYLIRKEHNINLCASANSPDVS